MRFVPACVALVIILASASAMAQQEDGTFEVPAPGYSGTDTLPADTDNKYQVHVEMNHDLVFRFNVIGDGEIMVCLIPRADPENIRYYTTQPVTEYSVRYPAVIGFDMDYTIMVNSTHPGDVLYNVSIHTEPAEFPNYTPYYILIAVGFVALVVFCWKFVVWQDKKEREEKKKAGRGKRHR